MEKVSGNWHGIACSIKPTWGTNDSWEGHTFTDDELKALFNDETITFDAVRRSGEPYKVTGKLDQQSFVDENGKMHEYIGFKLIDDRYEGFWNGQNVRIKRKWSTHTFSERELEDLCAGKEIEFQTLSNKTGELYTCKGSLAWQEFNTKDGKAVKFLGFKPNFN